MDKGTNQLLENLADAQHEIWLHWMKYLFSQCTFDEAGNAIIPADSVVHWQRQIETPYAELSEKEKQSDRDVVHQFLEEHIGLGL